MNQIVHIKIRHYEYFNIHNVELKQLIEKVLQFYKVKRWVGKL